MADSTTDIPVYQLPDATNVQGTDKLLLEQSDGDKQITKDELLKDVTDSISVIEEKLYTVSIATTDVVANSNTWNTGSHAGWYPYCYTGSKGKNAKSEEVDMGVTAKDELCIQGVTETDTQTLLDCENNGSYSTYDGSYKIYFRSVPTAAINLYISVKKKVTV